MMAKGQAEDVRRLKEEIAGNSAGQPGKRLTNKPLPDPWLLHPIRRTQSSPARVNSAASSPVKATAKKSAKKASKRAQR